jgi:methionyl-tRNA synthetase
MENPTTITYEEFSKIDLRVATILEVTEIPKADKLFALRITIGSEDRQIVAGIKLQYPPETLVGKQIIVVTNLEPRMVRGVQSHGMLLAASDESWNLALLSPDKPISAGSKVK